MLERGTRLGKYQVKEELGVGAMATVYKAKNVEDGSPVALKIPDRRLLSSAGALRQFSREGAALRALNHPNIVKVHSLGEKSGLPYIVMDYVDGHNLAEEVNSKHVFTINEVVNVLRPIAAALDYSHSRQIVHRDVKPGNIRIRRDGTPVLVDFGIVQTADGTVWDEAKALGSVWYMSPEQASGKSVNGNTDQYSLAIVAYEMLTGKVPFEGDNIVAVAVLQRDAVPPIPAGWSIPLATVLRRALDKDPFKRFPSCADFVVALADAATGQMPSQGVSVPQPQPQIATQLTSRSAKAGRRVSPADERRAESTAPHRARHRQVGKFTLVIPIAICLWLMVYFGRTPPAPAAAAHPVPRVPVHWDPRSVRSSEVRILGGISEIASGQAPNERPRFPVSSTRAIEWQCTLVYPPPSQSVLFPLQQVLSAQAGDDGTKAIPIELASGSSDQLLTGTLRPLGGHWRTGLYKLQLQHDGTAIAAGSFEIYADVHPARTNPRVIQIER